MRLVPGVGGVALPEILLVSSWVPSLSVQSQLMVGLDSSSFWWLEWTKEQWLGVGQSG